jgi:glycyl-tRNA synthetase beta chain
MPVSVGLAPDGKPTPALIKRIQTKLYQADVDIEWVMRERIFVADEGGKPVLKHREDQAEGSPLRVGLEAALQEALTRLPIAKLMSYQLQADCEMPGWSTVSFVRPAHGLLALHGAEVLPIQALGLRAGRHTQGHRFEAAQSPVVIPDADSYEQCMLDQGAVIVGFAARRAEIARQLAAAAVRAGGGFQPIADEALLDEVTGLVERPNVLVCEFEKEYLTVPQECLILTMKANQKYFPLLDAGGKLSNRFLVVSNVRPDDASLIVTGNERVVRPRLADAKFFFDQDRKRTLESRVAGLDKVVYHNRLGSQGQRMERVRAIARAIVQMLRDHTSPYTVRAKDELDLLAFKADQAARLAKTDLLTDMVGEFAELQGIMGGYYARHDGLRDGVAMAIEDHYKPRFAGDALPRHHTGVVVALADKLETLVGMFGIGQSPTGDKDPFALRRHALGVIRILVEKNLPLDLGVLFACAASAFDGLVAGWPQEERERFAARQVELARFVLDRLAGTLREQGYSAQEVDAVLAVQPQRLGEVPRRLAAVRDFAALPQAAALAAANKRIGNILKKAPTVDAHVSELLLTEPAEIALYAAMKEVTPRAGALFESADYAGSLQVLAALRAPVDAFFEDVMVNAEQADVRLNRQGLLKSLHEAMNRVADLSRLSA